MMYNLEQVLSGACTIIWLLGAMGQYINEQLHFELDDELCVLFNYGDSVIVRHGEKRYALDSESAHAIKVTIA